jgi:calcineurin-like phosphoesterase family protein
MTEDSSRLFPAGKILLTGDWHLGHLSIPSLASRPFPATPRGVGMMNEELLRRWNLTAGEDTWGLALGDMAMGKLDETLPLLARMRGARRWLVAGNHDRCHPCYHRRGDRLAKVRGYVDRYKAEGGFAEVTTAMPLCIPGTLLTPWLSHFPYRGAGDHAGHEERFTEHRLEDRGGWLLCGHVHGAWRQRGRMINVGVDAWGGWPVTLALVREMILAGPQDLDALPWEAGGEPERGDDAG